MNNQHKRLRGIWTSALAVLVGLLAVTSVGASPVRSPGQDAVPVIGLQPPVTPTASPLNATPAQFQISFLELGYGESVLISPYGNAQYTLRLPEGWQLLDGSYLDLDLSYAYGPAESSPPTFGEVSVVVDGQEVETLPIRQPALEHTHLRIPLSTESLNQSGRNHTVEVILDAAFLCNVSHKAELVVHPESFFSLTYNQFPLSVDLADYPRPFYQQTFQPDLVRFVMVSEPQPAELAGALAIAARLGELGRNQVVISATTDLEWLNRLENPDAHPEHLVIVGQPETHRLLPLLEEMQALPVSLRQREMSLSSQGPAAVSPGALFTYTLTLTNTTDQITSGLTLVNSIPWQTRFVNCEPSCITGREAPGQVRWSLPTLRPGRAVRFTLALSSTSTSSDSTIENVVTLLNKDEKPVNVDTLTTTLDLRPSRTDLTSSSSDKSDYFFVWNGRAIAENDGIVQEIVSPWNPSRAILIATGLNEQAVYKASQALSFETAFPGMGGSVALVSQIRFPEPASEEAPTSDLSLADLGYEDKTLFGSDEQKANYNFFLPAQWRLTDASYLELSFRHSQIIAYDQSALTILFNNAPLASIALDEKSSMGKTVRIEIPASAALPGESNKLTLQTDMRSRDVCTQSSSELWLTVSRDSYLHLDHIEETQQLLDLDVYPYPFDRDRHLADVLFALPLDSNASDWEAALRLAAALGNAAGGSALAPRVALDGPGPNKALENYHIIALGRPSVNPWLQEVNAHLPQPFQPGSDEIEQRIDDVVFRLPPGLSLGFVQLIPSPWNEERALMAVTGTSDEGVAWSVQTLVERPWKLEGNLALLRDQEVQTIDTGGLTSTGRDAAVSTAIPELLPTTVGEATVTAAPETTAEVMSTLTPEPAQSTASTRSTSSTSGRPRWILPLVLITAVSVIAILGIAIWQARRRRNAHKRQV